MSKTIKVVPVAIASWRSGYLAFQRMTGLFIVCVFLSFAVTYLTIYAMEQFLELSSNILLSVVWLLGSSVASAAVLSVLGIAVHRFILLGEVFHKAKPFGDFRSYLLFVCYLSGLLFLINIEALQMQLEWGLSHGNEEFIPPALSVARWVIPILVIVVFSGTAILFPAIAVAAEGASLRNALRDSHSHLLRIMLVLACVSVPILILEMASSLLLELGFISGMFWVVGIAIINVFATAIYAACASYIYACYARNLGRPAILI